MTAVRNSRYEFASLHQDEDGNLYFDVPAPILQRAFTSEKRFTVGTGTTPHSVAWQTYKAMLDDEFDVRPSGFWWVVAEVNEIVDPIENPAAIGSVLRVPEIDVLVSEILAQPRFFSKDIVT